MAVKKDSIRIQSTIKRELNDEFVKMAKSQNTSASKIIKELIIEYVEKNRKS